MDDINPEVMLLLEDLFAAFERGFEVAISLKNYSKNEAFNSIGEMLRLSLMNDTEGLKEQSATMKRELEESREKNRLLEIKRDELKKELEKPTKKNQITETEIMVRDEKEQTNELKKGFFIRFFDWI